MRKTLAGEDSNRKSTECADQHCQREGHFASCIQSVIVCHCQVGVSENQLKTEGLSWFVIIPLLKLQFGRIYASFSDHCGQVQRRYETSEAELLTMMMPVPEFWQLLSSIFKIAKDADFIFKPIPLLAHHRPPQEKGNGFPQDAVPEKHPSRRQPWSAIATRCNKVVPGTPHN